MEVVSGLWDKDQGLYVVNGFTIIKLLQGQSMEF